MYAYFLAFMYIVWMSWVLIKSLRDPAHRNEVQRTTWKFHLLPHFGSLLLVIAILVGQDMGDSIMKTCFVQSQSNAEYPLYRVLLLLPLVVFTPLILGAVSYTFCKYQGQQDTQYKRYITRHIAVVAVFSLAWFPVALLHFWNARIISGDPPEVLKDVITRQIACIAGSLSDFLTVAVQAIIIKLQGGYRRYPGQGSYDVARETARTGLMLNANRVLSD